MPGLFPILAIAVFVGALKLASRLGNDRGSWGMAPSLLGYFLYYHLATYDGDMGKPLLVLILLANAGTCLACAHLLFIGRRALSARMRALAVFVLIYLLSFAWGRTNGSELRELITNGSFICAGCLIGAVAAGPDLRQAIKLVLAFGLASTVLSLFVSDRWTFGDEGMMISPLDLGSITEARRTGFFPSMAFDAALICIAMIATMGVGVLAGKRGLSLRILLQVGALGVGLLIYVITSQFRVFIFAAGVSAVIALAVSARRQKWLLVVMGLVAMLTVAQFGAVTSLLRLPFFTREQLGEYSDRAEINRRSFQIFLMAPLRGSGFGSNGPMFREMGLEILESDTQAISSSHSAHVVVLTEIGIIGGIAWGGLLVWTLVNGFRRTFGKASGQQMPSYNQMMFFLTVAIVATQFFHGFLYSPWVWIALGWSYPSLRAMQKASRPSQLRRLVPGGQLSKPAECAQPIR